MWRILLYGSAAPARLIRFSFKRPHHNPTQRIRSEFLVFKQIMLQRPGSQFCYRSLSPSDCGPARLQCYEVPHAWDRDSRGEKTHFACAPSCVEALNEETKALHRRFYSQGGLLSQKTGLDRWLRRYSMRVTSDTVIGFS